MDLHAVRHARILEMLDQQSTLRVARLAEQLQVSEMTIRRDLSMLEEQGKLRRVHGGAVLTVPPVIEPVANRAAYREQEKEAIARLASGLINRGDNVYIGGGSTTRRLAGLLSGCPAERFTTNSLEIAETIAAQSRTEVHLLGGTLRASTRTAIGPETIEMLERRAFDMALVGMAAIDPDDGFLEPTEWHAWLVRTLRRRADRVVVLADHSKFTARSDFRVLSFQEVDTLVTDRPLPPGYGAAVETGRLRIVTPDA